VRGRWATQTTLTPSYEFLLGLAQRDFVFSTSLLRIVLSILPCRLPTTSAYTQDALMDIDLELRIVVDTFVDFLIVAIHLILRELNIYPETAFFTAKKYNLAVHQSRHPGLCDYINRAITAVHQEILSGTVKRIKVATFVQESWREQFVFDTTQLYQPNLEKTVKEAGAEQRILSVDAEEQLRGLLSRLKDHCNSLESPINQKSFRIIIEKDESPMLDSVSEQQWEDIPNTRTDDDYRSGVHTANMVKIRSVQAGRLV
jgi:mitotic spindle assembly checkpoint protein MAD2B